MFTLNVRNVNDAYETASRMLDAPQHHGMFRADSRNGPTWEMPSPVTTVYRTPEECVLWNGKRDCNPFFHFFESLWMLSGRDDVAYLDQFNSKMKQYSDDGVKFHGAYGYRWRNHFALEDQFHPLVHALNDPMTRRAVLGMWDPITDLLDPPQGAKDLPCNLSAVFSRRRKSDELDMTVFNRSNDIIFGAYGANAVHFSFLLQWVAAATDCKVGRYYQVSNNWHAYESVMADKLGGSCIDYYKSGEAVTSVMVPLTENPWMFLQEVDAFVEGLVATPVSQFLKEVASPMRTAWNMWKLKEREAAFRVICSAQAQCPRNDWLKACELWMLRRLP